MPTSSNECTRTCPRDSAEKPSPLSPSPRREAFQGDVCVLVGFSSELRGCSRMSLQRWGADDWPIRELLKKKPAPTCVGFLFLSNDYTVEGARLPPFWSRSNQFSLDDSVVHNPRIGESFLDEGGELPARFNSSEEIANAHLVHRRIEHDVH